MTGGGPGPGGDAEARRAARHERYLRDRERILARNKRWRAEHPEQVREAGRRWKAAHPSDKPHRIPRTGAHRPGGDSERWEERGGLPGKAVRPVPDGQREDSDREADEFFARRWSAADRARLQEAARQATPAGLIQAWQEESEARRRRYGEAGVVDPLVAAAAARQAEAARRRQAAAERRKARRATPEGREAARAATARYRERHPERVREYMAGWRERNRDRIREQSAAWRDARPGRDAGRVRTAEQEAERERRRREREAADPGLGDRRRAAARDRYRLKARLERLGLPPRTVKPAPARQVRADRAAADEFFARRWSAADRERIQWQYVATPPERLAGWDRYTASIRAGRGPGPVAEYLRAHGARLREEARMDSVARVLAGKPALDVEEEVRRRAEAEAWTPRPPRPAHPAPPVGWSLVEGEPLAPAAPDPEAAAWLRQARRQAGRPGFLRRHDQTRAAGPVRRRPPGPDTGPVAGGPAGTGPSGPSLG